jgi:hypothetical protein
MAFYIVVVVAWIEDLFIIYDVFMSINDENLIQLFENLGAINHNKFLIFICSEK